MNYKTLLVELLKYRYLKDSDHYSDQYRAKLDQAFNTVIDSIVSDLIEIEIDEMEV